MNKTGFSFILFNALGIATLSFLTPNGLPASLADESEGGATPVVVTNSVGNGRQQAQNNLNSGESYKSDKSEKAYKNEKKSPEKNMVRSGKPGKEEASSLPRRENSNCHENQGRPKTDNKNDAKNPKTNKKPPANGHWNEENGQGQRVLDAVHADPRKPMRRSFQNLQYLKDNDPELFQLIQEDIDFEKALRDLSKKYRAAKGDDQKEKLRKEITEKTEKHFLVRQKRRELELERMKAWLGQLEEQVKRSRENSKYIIERRINILLGNDLGEF